VCKFYGGDLPSELQWVVAASVKLNSSKCYEHLSKNSVHRFATADFPLTSSMEQIHCMQTDENELEADLIGSELNSVKDSYENINGTFGMLGNVWEWVRQAQNYFYQNYETIKGGSFANVEQSILFENSVSNFVPATTKQNNIGFRCTWDYAQKGESK